ncbi:MAG TPA: acyl-CoA dehydrogenase [Syntrophomonadaceae bacterium]|nr:acyl-CoA dehydrogenase [Syntrophomonadaceae bacterium]HPU47973.1 acyl-CoA dehydrogenase [Syntrophomonadaceae bacterium]
MSANFAYANTRDFEFIIQEWLPTDIVFNYEQFKDYYSKEEVKSILEPFRKMCKEVVEPTNEDGDKIGCTFANGKVTTPPSFGPLFKQLQQDGWGTANIDDSEDAMTMPNIIFAACQEMLAAANPAFMPYIGLTTGAAELIQAFADEDLKEIFLPKMMDGTWAGTMCLTEPTAGSDVGDILSKAYPTDDPRIYKIKGQKIFITGGDNDFTENIIHLYLARVEGARPGTAGISLFIVPKYWVNPDGTLEDNDVQTTGIEHKLGQYGSVTASLSFGENGKCRGWLIGNPPDENGKAEGMAQMFKMMNYARLGTGLLGLAVTANAVYNAREYAKERVQGRPLTNMKGDRVTIINHEDIRRSLLQGKAHVDVFRAMIMKTYFMFDIRAKDPDPEKRQEANDFIEVVTPLCKAYPTDEAWWLIGEAIQCYGGYGYCEEYPVAQIARDSKIYSIWEGTNYIQALDLVGRKWTMKKGTVYAKWFKQVQDFYEANKNAAGFEKEFEIFGKAVQAIQEIQMTIGGYFGQGKISMLPLYARRILTATAMVYGAWCILEQAMIAKRRAEEVGPDHYDYDFYFGKVCSARYYLNNVVPQVMTIADIIKGGDTSALDIPLTAFDY